MDRDLQTGHISAGQRPALIVVDMTLGFTDPASPLGGDFSQEVAVSAELVQWFHQNHWPVYFSTVVYDDDSTASVFRQRLPDLNILQRGSHWIEVDPVFGPVRPEQIIEKHWPSAFFATPLAGKLKQQQVDTLVITGLTTSGCVRATAVDGLQHNLYTLVVSDACGDRNHSAHQASLHDIHAKYGLVTTAQAVRTLLTGSINNQ